MASFEFPSPIGPVEEPKQGEKVSKKEPSKSEKEVAKEKLIDRSKRGFAEDERTPAVWSQTELIFAEVTVEPDARPGRREIRVVTKRASPTRCPSTWARCPEVARKPMRPCSSRCSAKEYMAQRKRPPEEEELRNRGAVHDERPDRGGRR